MNVADQLGGNYLTQFDLQLPQQVWQIAGATLQVVGQGASADEKVCVKFSEHAKPLALNKTNLKRIADLYGTDTDGWIGKPLRLYRAQAQFQGDIVLCVRVCDPKKAPPEPVFDENGQPHIAQPQQQPQQPTAANIPF